MYTPRNAFQNFTRIFILCLALYVKSNPFNWILDLIRETMEANNNINNNNNLQEVRDPLVNVRDRLFHTLFFRLSLAYARLLFTSFTPNFTLFLQNKNIQIFFRSCPRQMRRLLECFILLKVSSGKLVEMLLFNMDTNLHYSRL